MKQKIITATLTILAVLAPALIVPVIFNDSTYILKMWALLIGGALLLILLLCNIKTFNIDKKDILMLAFIGLIIISTCFSSSLKISILGQRTRHEGALMLITYICIYFASKKYFKHENYEEILNILFFTCMAIGILGIAQKYVKFARLYPIFSKGICGTFGNSNFFGSFVTLILPISVSIFLLKGNKRSLGLSLVMFFNIISCGTRSAWVAFIVGSIFFLIFLIKQKNKKYFIRIGILIICFVIIFMYLFNSFKFIKEIINPAKQEVNQATITTTEEKVKKTGNEIKEAVQSRNINRLGSGRMEIWKMTLKLIWQKPILGCGPDNLNKGLHIYCKEETENFVIRTITEPDKAHNEYLQIAATIGIPALIIYLIFLGLIVFPKMKEMFKNGLLFIITVTIICYLAQAFFNISTIGVAPLFWMLLGMADNKEMLDILKIN